MTDGHILFRSSLYNQGQRPGVDLALSVSRVGQQTQKRIQNLLSTHIKQVLAQAEQLQTISQFSFDLPQETQLILKQRRLIDELIKQPTQTYIPKEIQVVLLGLTFTNFLLQNSVEFIKDNYLKLIEIFKTDPILSPMAKTLIEADSETDLLRQLESFVNYLQGQTHKQDGISPTPTTPPPTTPPSASRTR
jgi:F-type H+-transporting ATPase subunit alpha